MTDTKFKPGCSGNPGGRKKGSQNRKTLLRKELEKDGSALAAAIKTAALEGNDTTAMSLWLARLEPPLRPTAQRVTFELDTQLSIAEQAKQVVQAMARGELDPDTAKQIMEMLTCFVGLRDIETFMAELRKLREARDKDHIPGGVKTI